MSYILNALKKAEHDRSREEPENLDDFVNSGWDPYEKTAKSSTRYWLPVAILVIAALLFYGFSNLRSQMEIRSMPAVVNIEKATVASSTAESVLEAPTVAEKPEIRDTPKAITTPMVSTLLPDVSITGHIFIRSGSRLNRIFVGESTYHVGDMLDGKWLIESINSDSLELRSGTQTTELPLR
ncbi:hypothetical protein N9161_02840 [Porticoccaceae bacterium]|jgi:hypothetical protein|nr:hypothetical protein [Porticoccaceae bacterium]MBT6593765.1 hypothetical protein [Porticoccaceae bacterium]MDB4427141.1 hypothetical protein [Porticoccaceae bacterium]MDC3261113.1 hypothetical protein [bacterium]MDG1079336.1 hypothetical protein [Porticoccaceae bacterium]